MKIIGISGQMNSGKDSIADRFVEIGGYRKISIGTPIKEFCEDVFEFTEKQLWGPSEFRNKFDERFPAWWERAAKNFEDNSRIFIERTFGEYNDSHYWRLKDWFQLLRQDYPHLTPRIALQSIGGEWGRWYDKDIWVSLFLAEARQRGGPLVVVSDIRYRNELVAIREQDGTLIRIKRAATDQLAQSVGIQDHSSEAEQLSFRDDEFDFVIQNDGTIEELYKKIDIILKQLA